MSALIRDAVTATYGDRRDVDVDLAVIDTVAGAWAERSGDGAEWVDGLRSGRRTSAG